MKVITAVTEDKVNDDFNYKVFIAGGITGCPDWQSDIIAMLQKYKDTEHVTVYNPRRKNFPINDPSATEEQIKWEFKYLKVADELIFWFPCETLCPITLFEYGKWLGHKDIFVGCHPDYKRKDDLLIQTQLVKPEIKIVFSLEELAEQYLEDLECNKCP